MFYSKRNSKQADGQRDRQDRKTDRQADILDAEEQLLRDAQQGGSDGQNQQNQTTEHMKGEVPGS